MARARGTPGPTLAAGILLTFGLHPSAVAGQQQRSVICAGAPYAYLLEAPAGSVPRPAMLLLHGAGGEPASMIEAWRGLARRQHLVLIAPQLPEVPAFEARAPAVFRCIVDDARRAVAIDSNRIYIFGHSMGGYLAYDAAMLQSGYFAGIAVHAMDIAPAYSGIVDSAPHHLPVAMYVGDQDPLVAVDRVRRTRDLLEAHGFLVHYVVIANHDHDYFAVSDWVNADVWRFLKPFRRPR